jgi:pyruvate kinase
MVRIDAIVTAPPYAPFLEEVVAHPIVSGLRFNTVMPIKESPRELLARLSSLGSPVWVDLKGRQLRVVEAALPPFTEVRLSHRVRVRVPCDAFFSDGREHARVAAVDGHRLILEDGPRRFVGPGESVNIVDASLEVEGTLTDTDRTYLDAMRELGLNRVMLSFVERRGDVDEVRERLPAAEIALKIESRRGLDLVADCGASLGRLVAARGDLYVEVYQPHRIVGAVMRILAADPTAIAASRLFPSLARGPVPDAVDVGDAAFLIGAGYRTFMLGDDVCLRRDSVIAALNLLDAVAREFP